MKKTHIQWCDSTVNPVMGCDGCELWPRNAQIVVKIVMRLLQLTALPADGLLCTVRRALGDREMSAAYRDRDQVANEIRSALLLPDAHRQAVVDVIRGLAKCYAGLLGTMRAG